MLRTMLPARSTSRFGSLLDATTEMDRLFDGFFNGTGPISATFLPLSVWEDNQHVYIEAETPGAKIDDIELVFHDGALRIAYSRKAPEGDRKVWVNERGYGHFERLLRLPDSVDENSIQAELNSGVLCVRLAKRPELQPRKITVQAVESQQALPANGDSQS